MADTRLPMSASPLRPFLFSSVATFSHGRTDRRGARGVFGSSLLWVAALRRHLSMCPMLMEVREVEVREVARSASSVLAFNLANRLEGELDATLRGPPMSEYSIPRMTKVVYWVATIFVSLFLIFLLNLSKPNFGIYNAVSAATLTSAVAIWFPEAVDKWLWYRQPFKLLLGIPDLRGRWVGTITSHLSNETHRFA